MDFFSKIVIILHKCHLCPILRKNYSLEWFDVVNMMVLSKHFSELLIFIRPQNFCGRIMLWSSRRRCRRRCRRLWKFGFRSITLVVVDRLLWYFDMMFVTTIGRLVLILGDVAPTVLVKGAKRGENGYFFKIIVEWLFFMRFWWFFLHCILDQILSTKCANGFHEIWTVSKLWGVKKGQRPKNQLFYFWSDFKNSFFIGILMKIPVRVFQTDFW